jgi:choline dehydrogenase-like flavoprotein
MKGMGKSFKESVKAHYPAYITFTGYMEMIPNRDSYIDLDEKVKDHYGLPSARRHWKLSDDDWKRFHAVQDWGRQILTASKSQILSVADNPTTNHEIGGCRMGSDPKRSILNQYCQAHDVPNLYVVDASAFPSASEKNPTHTIMAMASRAADNIADRLKKGEV